MNPAKNKQRRPRAKESPSDAKQIRLATPLDDNQRKPAWSFLFCDFDSPFGWNAASKEDLLQVVHHLGELERLTLAEIFGQRNRGNHQPRPQQLGKPAQSRLKKIKLDPERLVSLRLTGTKRIWLIREGSILSLLWWDPQHQVWPQATRSS